VIITPSVTIVKELEAVELTPAFTLGPMIVSHQSAPCRWVQRFVRQPCICSQVFVDFDLSCGRCGLSFGGFGFGIGGFARIDNAAHVGGLLVGGWLGLLIAPRGTATLSSLWQRNETSAEPRPLLGPLLRVLGIVALGALLVGGLLIKPFWA